MQMERERDRPWITDYRILLNDVVGHVRPRGRPSDSGFRPSAVPKPAGVGSSGRGGGGFGVVGRGRDLMCIWAGCRMVSRSSEAGVPYAVRGLYVLTLIPRGFLPNIRLLTAARAREPRREVMRRAGPCVYFSASWWRYAPRSGLRHPSFVRASSAAKMRLGARTRLRSRDSARAYVRDKGESWRRFGTRFRRGLRCDLWRDASDESERS